MDYMLTGSHIKWDPETKGRMLGLGPFKMEDEAAQLLLSLRQRKAIKLILHSSLTPMPWKIISFIVVLDHNRKITSRTKHVYIASTQQRPLQSLILDKDMVPGINP